MPKPSFQKYIAIKPGYTRYADWYLHVTLGMYLSLSLSLSSYIHIIATRVHKVHSHVPVGVRSHTHHWRVRVRANTHTHILYLYAHEHSHRYLCYALFFIMVGYGVHHDDSALWLLPHLGRRTDPARMIGDYFKDLRVDVKQLPENANAQGTRKGCNPQSRLFCLPRANFLEAVNSACARALSPLLPLSLARLFSLPALSLLCTLNSLTLSCVIYMSICVSQGSLVKSTPGLMTSGLLQPAVTRRTTRTMCKTSTITGRLNGGSQAQ